MKIIQVTGKNGFRTLNRTVTASNSKGAGVFRDGALRQTAHDAEGRLYRAVVSTDEVKRAAGVVPANHIIEAFGPEEAARRLREFEEFIDVLGRNSV